MQLNFSFSWAWEWVPTVIILRTSSWVSFTVGSSLYQWSCSLEQIYELAVSFISAFFHYFWQTKKRARHFFAFDEGGRSSQSWVSCGFKSHPFRDFFSVNRFRFAILIDIICHTSCAQRQLCTRGFRISLSIVKRISKDHVVVFTIVCGS